MNALMNPVANFENALATPLVRQQLESALGKNANAFAASLLDVYISGMQKYEPYNVIEEAMKAAVLNLPITKSLGFAYLVPYKGKVQFQLGYKGMIQLAMRSGQLKNINAGVIYEGEWKGTDKLRGVFDFTGEATSDKAVGYFSYMELINGFEKTIYWTKAQVMKHAEAKSPSYKHKSSAWHTDFDAMAIKTTLRALFSKYAPMSVDFITAMSYDAESIELEQPPIGTGDIDITPKKRRLAEVKKPVSFKAKPKNEKKPEPAKETRAIPEVCAELQGYMDDVKLTDLVDSVLEAQGADRVIIKDAIDRGNTKACDVTLSAIKAELEKDGKPEMI